ncbi:MAG: hypothetical protein PHU70_02085, partial [Dehalococcoidia bacterium]|nr:hypothetical protein [Dehalococcoidia bacterium]
GALAKATIGAKAGQAAVLTGAVAATTQALSVYNINIGTPISGHRLGSQTVIAPPTGRSEETVQLIQP